MNDKKSKNENPGRPAEAGSREGRGATAPGTPKTGPAEAPAAKPRPKPSGDSLEITCPECKAVLVVLKSTGEVIEHYRLTSEEASAKRIEEAIDRAKRSTELAEQKFNKAKEREKNKMDRLSKLFEETMKKKIEEGDTGRPERPFDLD